MDEFCQLFSNYCEQRYLRDNILSWPFRCLLYSMVIQVPFKCFQVFTIEFVKWRHGEVTTKLYCVALSRILFSKCLSTAM